MVTTGEDMRTMNRSPGKISSGSLPAETNIIAGSQAAAFQYRAGGASLGFHFRGSSVKVHCAARCFSGFAGKEQLKNAVHLRGGAKPAGFGQQHAAPHFGRLDAGNVESGPLAGVASVTLAPWARYAHPPAAGARLPFHFLFDVHRAHYQRTVTVLLREGAVNQQPKILRGVLFRNRHQPIFSISARSSAKCAVVELTATIGAFSKTIPAQIRQLRGAPAHWVIIDHIGFCEDDNTVPNTQQPADVEMFASLWFDGLIGSYNKQNQINPPHPR